MIVPILFEHYCRSGSPLTLSGHGYIRQRSSGILIYRDLTSASPWFPQHACHIISCHMTIDGDYNRGQMRKNYYRPGEERGKNCTKSGDEVVNGACQRYVNRLPHGLFV
jgi:hypothetical protein